ncbi:hypothetical protein JR316_0004207 [Psilocybe cubensis]|uniref:Uncharacterized protein n=2 Tax=Psilocybe cubensis TaxID=181762 RepID=A0ACB8H384_PSICU|nr:hypothetical protein JR316_0004207 [Psilocybe cubensis]KAH9482112.1 hypothetical protein JR316_0004207 [Psilocybe cubensis]
MTHVSEDPELVVGKVAKELKAARLRIEELEAQIKNADKTLKERVEAAEYASDVLRKNYDALSTENKLLRESLEELKDTKKPRIKVVGARLEENVAQQKRDNRNMVDKSISADDQSGAVMEHKLEQARAKYKTKKQQMKDLTQSCKELERQLNLSHAEKEEAVRAERAKAKPLPLPKREEAPKPPIPVNPTWNQLEAYMLNLPKVGNFIRPQNHHLQPICHRSTDLKSLLASDPHTLQLSKNFLYLSDLLFWCSDMQNALAIGPIYVFDKASQSWFKRSIFQNLYGTTFSLFYQRDSRVVYVGLYKAINLRQWATDGSTLHSESTELGENLRNKYASALAESMVIDNLNKRQSQVNSAPAMISTLKSFIHAGILKYEPLGLQNVGFDEDLYTVMVKNYRSRQQRAGRSVVLLPEPSRVDSGTPINMPHNKRKRLGD